MKKSRFIFLTPLLRVFQHKKSLNGLFEFCKQSADHLKIPIFSFLITCIPSVRSYLNAGALNN